VKGNRSELFAQYCVESIGHAIRLKRAPALILWLVPVVEQRDLVMAAAIISSLLASPLERLAFYGLSFMRRQVDGQWFIVRPHHLLEFLGNEQTA